MKLNLLAITIALLVASGALLFSSVTNNVHVTDLSGTDVSWPNCHILLTKSEGWGIVGVTGGLDFHTNPCLTQESTWFTKYALYMNTGYPGSNFHLKFPTFPQTCSQNDKNCLAYNYGYNAAKYALDYALQQNLHANMWWLDVETENSWTSNPNENVAALQGMVDAIKHFEFLPVIGFYSSPNQWLTITGGWHNHLPAWVATGETDVESAIQTCQNPSFTGGLLQLAQYTPALDKNYTCNPNFPNIIYNH